MAGWLWHHAHGHGSATGNDPSRRHGGNADFLLHIDSAETSTTTAFDT